MKPLRLFLAVWPDDKTRAELARLSAQVNRSAKGRPVVERNLHMTLAFLGDVESTELDRLIECIDPLEFQPFSLNLDQLEYWAKPRLTCAKPSNPPDDFLSLQSRLSQQLKQSSFRTDSRPYRPHVTLVRKTQAMPVAVPFVAIEWPVERIELVQSELDRNGAKYHLLTHWQAATD